MNKKAKNGIKEIEVDTGESGFFDTPECIPPFKNIILQNDNKTCVWVVDISRHTEDAMDNKFYNYALIFFPKINQYNSSYALERMDVYTSKSGYFDFFESYAKEIDGGCCKVQVADKVTAVTMASCILRLFSIINCKNIELLDNPAPERLNNSRIKKNKLPLCSYYTIAIKAVSRKDQDKKLKGLWDNRVHLCRGHFKTYTEEKPLFGKIVGRFWWQASVRGNPKEGMIVKDYEIDESLH